MITKLASQKKLKGILHAEEESRQAESQEYGHG
jgi:hypothetical protein